MIAIKINDINNFMQDLLVQDTFDAFLLTEGTISTSTTFQFNGRINQDFFDQDELETLCEDFTLWKHLKHICYEIIRGKKVPTYMKLVFALPKSGYEKIIKNSGMNITPENIGGLYLHIIYENNEINIITGTSLNLFTMDKTLDSYWDKFLLTFLSSHFDAQLT